VSLVAPPAPAASRGGDARLRSACGRTIPLHVDRWFAELAPEEEPVLAMAVGPVLDVGCGPGRHTLALARLGTSAIGVDESPSAVRVARDRGAAAHLASVFDPLPGEGRWGSALLLDGNVGIGGDPERLLRRVRRLLRPAGRVLLEAEAPGAGRGTLTVRIELDRRVASPWFPWATVGADELPALTSAAGFALGRIWCEGGRWFAAADAR